MNSKFSVLSFFSGIGLLDLGFEKNDFNILFVNEIHKPFLDGYKHSRKILNIQEPFYGFSNKGIEEILINDFNYINEIIQKEKSFKNLIGFIGGPPCPDFSIGGKINSFTSSKRVRQTGMNCVDVFLSEIIHSFALAMIELGRLLCKLRGEVKIQIFEEFNNIHLILSRFLALLNSKHDLSS